MLNLINSKILISGAAILAAAALAIGATFAFFSDTETSTNNTIEAGAIDLLVDNTCYYNGQACTNGFWGGDQTNGTCACTWTLDDGDLDEQVFFELSDVKPGDFEEDTISLHVNNNDAWLCNDVTLTSDNDNTLTEPEDDEGDDLSVGELADHIDFLWWADDGDNVLEDNESTLPSGPIGVLSVGQTATTDLVDSNNNIFGPTPSPFPGGETKFIAKAWCFGAIAAAPVPADRGTVGAGDDNNGPDTATNAADLAEVTSEDGGFSCDGSAESNITQTDSFTADIGFRAVQARNNSPYECVVPTPIP